MIVIFIVFILGMVLESIKLYPVWYYIVGAIIELIIWLILQEIYIAG